MTDTYELPEPFGFIEPTGRSPAFHYLRRPDEAGMPVFTADQMQEYARLAVKAERERAALIVEYVETPTFRHGGREYDNTVLLRQQIAAAIRKG